LDEAGDTGEAPDEEELRLLVTTGFEEGRGRIAIPPLGTTPAEGSFGSAGVFVVEEGLILRVGRSLP